MNFGYIRVSAKDQNEARQVAVLETLDNPHDNLYMDKQSGKDFQRPAYHRMLGRLQSRDVLYILSIDRLGRNYYDTFIGSSYCLYDCIGDCAVPQERSEVKYLIP